MNETVDSRRAWVTVGMVFLFMLINFADKAVIGLSSTSIIKELGLTHAQFGALGSAFFILFSISGVVVGFLSNRISTKAIMLTMSIVWAITLLPMAGTVTLTMLLASRIVLGAAEGPAFPIALHAVYKWFGDAKRAVPSSVVACGAAFGTGVVAPLLTWVIVRFGWHAAFMVLSVIGFCWAILWLALGKDGPLDRRAGKSSVESTLKIPYMRLLFSRTALGVFIAGFAAYWIIALNIVWLANYLVRGLHLTPSYAAWIVLLPSVMQLVLSPICAFISQSMTKAGYSSRYSRGLFGCACVAIAGIAMICLPLAPVGPLKIALIGLSFSIGSVVFPLGTTLIGEISPTSQRGAMLGITNSVHTLAGLIAPVAMGVIVDVGIDPAEGFRTGYMSAGLLVVTLGLIAACLIDPTSDLGRFRRLGFGTREARDEHHNHLADVQTANGQSKDVFPDARGLAR
ncbi:MFS transporter [Paraburkholderia terrae]|uniref:MFS transporter n=1 Tax=Paraburkholderia terrae TaxID=311230 RepID=UPI00200AAA91|nr:MFS transporter [Paraburkholderia terrae]BDC45057.1 MFS transporter [Paraburkholderia terrae]